MRSCSSCAAGIAFVLVAAETVGAAQRTRVIVAPDSVVQGAAIRLADIAAIDGDGAGALGGIALGTAPAAGETRTLEGGFVLQALRRANGSLDDIGYTIPALVRVRRAAQEVPETAVRALVEQFVVETLGERASDAVVRSVELPGPIRIPAGAYRARVIPAGGTPVLGRTRLQLEFAVEDRPVRTVWITADVGVYGPVLVARRPFARGDTIAATDVSVERRDLSQLPADVLGDPADVSGMIARAAIAAADPVRREQVSVPPAVHRGDVVLLVAERPGLRLTVPGEVREDAGLSQPVRVVNRTSRKELVGRVIDGSTVAVDF